MIIVKVLADLLGSLHLTVYSRTKKKHEHTQSLKNVGHAFWITARESFAYTKKSVKLIEECFF